MCATMNTEQGKETEQDGNSAGLERVYEGCL